VSPYRNDTTGLFIAIIKIINNTQRKKTSEVHQTGKRGRESGEQQQGERRGCEFSTSFFTFPSPVCYTGPGGVAPPPGFYRKENFAMWYYEPQFVQYDTDTAKAHKRGEQ